MRWLHVDKNQTGKYGLHFTVTINRKSAKAIYQEINRWPWQYWVQNELEDIRRYSVASLRGWTEYYGLFGKSNIRNLLFHFDKRLARRAMKKYKHLRRLMQAVRKIGETKRRCPWRFPHWQQ